MGLELMGPVDSMGGRERTTDGALDQAVFENAPMSVGRIGGPTKGRSTGASAAAVVLSWALGVWAPALRVFDHGSSGLRASLILAAAMVPVAILMWRRLLRPVVIVVAVIVTGVLTMAATVELVGRFPSVLATVGVVLAAVSLGLPVEEQARRTLSALPILFVGGCGWVTTGSWWALVPYVVAGMLTAARSIRPTVAGWVEQQFDTGATRSAVWFRTLCGAARDRGSAVAAALSESVRGAGARGFDATRGLLRRWRRSWRDMSWNIDVVVPVTLGLVAGLAHLPMFWRLASDSSVVVRGINDFAAHYERVEALRWSPPTMPVPHPVFHLSVKALEVLTGAAWAMALIETLAVAVTAALLYRIARSTALGERALVPLWAAVFAIAGTIVESSAVLVPVGDSWWQRAPGFDQLGRGAGFVSIHLWGSPTITLALPFYLVLISLVIRYLKRPGPQPPGRWMIATLAALACLTMPAAALGLVPAAILLLVFSNWPVGRRGTLPETLRRSSWFLVTALVVIVWQIWFLATSQSPLEEATWRFNPFWLVDYFGMNRLATWAAVLLIAATAWAGGRNFLRDPAVAWCTAATLVAAFPMLLLQETGWKATHGGMAVSFGVSFGLLTLFSIRFLMQEVAWRFDSGARLGVAHVTAIALLLAGCVAGVLDLLAGSGVISQL